jgi:hypothetical protein
MAGMTEANSDPISPELPDADLIRLSRQCWGMLETLHVVTYLTKRPALAYAALGLHGMDGYFASRAAPLGAAGPDLVTATFYVFAPGLVATALPCAWQRATPEQVTQARYDSTRDQLREILDDAAEGAAIEEAAALAATACAGLSAPGRPMYAALSALPWPADPLMRLWHAAALVREHRGDGHIAALLQAPLDPVEALIISGLSGGSLDFLRFTRGWTDQQWADGYQRLRDRGLLAGEDQAAALTPAGAALRDQVESATDRAALAGWQHLGAADSVRLRELLRPIRQRIIDSGALPGFLSGRSS